MGLSFSQKFHNSLDSFSLSGYHWSVSRIHAESGTPELGVAKAEVTAIFRRWLAVRQNRQVANPALTLESMTSHADFRHPRVHLDGTALGDLRVGGE